MKENNFKTLLLILGIIIGIIIFILSYYETSFMSLIYQLVSYMIIIISLVSLYLIIVLKNFKKEMIFKTKKNKSKNEDLFKKNLISIDLDEADNLSDEEKKLIELLKSHDDKMEQRDITKKLFKGNKVKSHRIILSLEKKDLIIKKKYGKTNKVFLKN